MVKSIRFINGEAFYSFEELRMSLNNIAIIGLGYMGMHHLKVMDQFIKDSLFEDLNVSMVCDVDANHVKDVAERFAVPNFTTDAEEAITDTSVDGIIIATPPKYHFDQAMSAIRECKPFYCEKPVGFDVSETRILAGLLEHKRVPNQVGLVLRHSPAINYIKRILEREDLGKPYLCIMNANSKYPEKGKQFRTDFVKRGEESGGGILHEENIHDIDTLLYLFGDFKISDVLFDRFDPTLNVETSVDARLHFSDRLDARYRSRWHKDIKGCYRWMEIFCEEGKITARYFVNGTVGIEKDGGSKLLTEDELSKAYFKDNHINLPNKAYKQWYSYLADHAFIRLTRKIGLCTPNLNDALKVEDKIQQMYSIAKWK